MALEVGSIVEGVVTGITHFGAFVTLPDGQTGLVHISEVADTYVRDVKDFLKEQDKVKVKVIGLDKSGKIGLSIRQVTNSGPRRRVGTGPTREARRPSMSFEDKLARFLKESDERQSDLRRNTDLKRGGRGSSRRSWDVRGADY
ncbi:MAG: S1 RNA-binding domain-containing protein [Firmicutes bacterium]|jgi:S1 RNA binding domain protein|nr:S1 RNA-binding domain-containing protein [Bacillota bacterium]